MLDTGLTSYSFYRKAVEDGWNPADVPMEDDVEPLAELHRDHPGVARLLKGALAKFGAGEEAVTEDLAPLAVALEETEDQMFVATQIADEAVHTEFFHRYWRRAVNPAERQAGRPTTDPGDDAWFPGEYHELFDRMETAMHELLDDAGRRARARAISHYHLAVEGVLAQAGYWWLNQNYGEESTLPTLPGLMEGVEHVRRDESRHVGFGATKLEEYVADGMDSSVVDEAVNPLLPLIQRSLRNAEPLEVDESKLEAGYVHVTEYAAAEHTRRIQRIKNPRRQPATAD